MIRDTQSTASSTLTKKSFFAGFDVQQNNTISQKNDKFNICQFGSYSSSKQQEIDPNARLPNLLVLLL
jgi:hypothetical protein